MAEDQQQDGQKTLVAFVVGLLIGGMLVWAFSGPSANAPTPDSDVDSTENASEMNDTEDDETVDDMNGSSGDGATSQATPTLSVGEGEVVVTDQPAGTRIALESAVYPVSEGWIGVREYNNEQLGFILGVVRFSESDGLVPAEIILQRPTTAGNTYAVVIYTEDGDRDFSLAGDVQIDTIFDTFTAQ